MSSFLDRRQFLSGAYGMGTIALATLLQKEGLLANPALAGGGPQHFDLTPKPAHGFGQAKAMISMFMQGGPSHIDLFEPKPELMKLDGKVRCLRSRAPMVSNRYCMG